MLAFDQDLEPFNVLKLTFIALCQTETLDKWNS